MDLVHPSRTEFHIYENLATVIVAEYCGSRSDNLSDIDSERSLHRLGCG